MKPKLRVRSPLAALLLLGASSSAAALLPSQSHSLRVGASTALAACPGIDASGSRRAVTTLPSHPALSASLRLSRGIRHVPASDAGGRLLLALDDGHLSQLDARGRELWNVSTDSEITSAPIIGSDGSRMLVTRSGELRSFDEQGALRCKHALPGIDPQRDTLLIPTPAGGSLLANGAHVLELDARCELQRDTHASERVVSLLAPALALVAVLEDGSVLRAPPVGSFQRVARLGGRVSSAAVRGDELLAVVDQHALVAVPLTGGTPRTLASEGSLALVGAPAVLANGGSVLCTEDDLLSVRAQDGHETLRIPLAVSRGLQRPRPPQVLADPRAQLLVVQATREALSVSPDGKLATVEGATCSEPFAPVPLGNGRVAIACRSGQLFFLADNP